MRPGPQFRRRARRAGRAPNHAGTAALEYALILPVLLLMVLGAVDTGRVMWLQVTLDRAVEAAARCAAINTTACGSTASIQAFAASQAFGTTIAASAFTSVSASCGARVSAVQPFTFVIPWMASRNVTLAATACYPVG